MSLDTDVTGIVSTIRTALAHGENVSSKDLQLALSVIFDLADLAAGGPDDVRTVVEAQLLAVRTAAEAQLAILQAIGAGDASAEVDTAETAIEAALDAADTAVADALDDADEDAVITAVPNTIMDGGSA